ncbi:hypothetical protein niasHT_031590 [Heterodera trifolii]|uniref:Uncharacterized protein n=1 Tax=Heterodera trifolii TaxID=157864 RepID=A0ABD2J4B0_9BILA
MDTARRKTFCGRGKFNLHKDTHKFVGPGGLARHHQCGGAIIVTLTNEEEGGGGEGPSLKAEELGGGGTEQSKNKAAAIKQKVRWDGKTLPQGTLGDDHQCTTLQKWVFVEVLQ